MIKKILFVAIICAISIITNAQEQILITGFPEKNFKTERKPIEKYAIKNEVPVEEVPGLFSQSLTSNIYTKKKYFNFVNIADSLLPDFNKYNYSIQEDKYGNEYLGFDKQTDISELANIMNEKYTNYLLHFSSYHIYTNKSIFKRSGHLIDYFILNKDLDVVATGKLKVKGLVYGSVFAEVFEGKYIRFGNKIAENLYSKIDFPDTTE